MIRVSDIHKSFGDVRAVSGISFDAPDGKITGLLGPNGAGKSTTLRILYTVLKPDAGSATIDGADVVTHSPDAVTSPSAARKAFHRDSAPRSRSPAALCTTRKISSSMSHPTGLT